LYSNKLKCGTLAVDSGEHCRRNIKVKGKFPTWYKLQMVLRNVELLL